MSVNVYNCGAKRVECAERTYNDSEDQSQGTQFDVQLLMVVVMDRSKVKTMLKMQLIETLYCSKPCS